MNQIISFTQHQQRVSIREIDISSCISILVTALEELEEYEDYEEVRKISALIESSITKLNPQFLED
jgi:hypothetical protein